jgi:hypothetical protein
LGTWRTWLKQVTKKPERIWQATPVCGAWQLQFMVHNLAPAVQKVIVEQQQSDGTWQEIVSRYTIEFRAKAARPTTKLKRELTAPVATSKQNLRLRVTGTGQVALSHIALTNGVERLHSRMRVGFQNRLLGGPAPKQGMPKLTIQDRRHVFLLDFTPLVRR